MACIFLVENMYICAVLSAVIAVALFIVHEFSRLCYLQSGFLKSSLHIDL